MIFEKKLRKTWSDKFAKYFFKLKPYVDTNECLSNPCSVNADCQNINGSFTCTCKDGFDGTGFVCNGSLKKFITLYLTICCTHRCMLFYVLF